MFKFGNHTFEAERDLINTTPLSEADPTWRYTDTQGHEHYWKNGYPTLEQVTDSEGTDEYPAVWHYECSQCREVIQPPVRAVNVEHFNLGLLRCYVDGVFVTPREFKRRLLKAMKDEGIDTTKVEGWNIE